MLKRKLTAIWITGLANGDSLRTRWAIADRSPPFNLWYGICSSNTRRVLSERIRGHFYCKGFKRRCFFNKILNVYGTSIRRQTMTCLWCLPIADQQRLENRVWPPRRSSDDVEIQQIRNKQEWNCKQRNRILKPKRKIPELENLYKGKC
jgi:hypothetical protein